jgi:transposase
VDIPQESKTKENIQMTQKPRRTFTDEQKAEAVKIVERSDKPIHQIAKEMSLSESALRRWIKQAQIEQQPISQGAMDTNSSFFHQLFSKANSGAQNEI